MMSPELWSILRCASCHGHLTTVEPASSDRRQLACKACGRRFSIRDDIPDMMPLDEAAIAEWGGRLALLGAWLRGERGRPLRTPRRPWHPPPALVDAYFALAASGGGTGRLLEIGCADGRRSAHFGRKSYFGVDPLVLRDSYPFPFVRAVGERLPFAPAAFDAVVAIEVLDHVIDPGRCLAEAARVLAPGGDLFVFITAIDQPQEPEHRAGYTLEERDVHRHAITRDFLEKTLTPGFAHVEVHASGGYVACHGRARLA